MSTTPLKISLCSDLHLEFDYQELPGGEVLILAGDIAETRSIRKDHHSTKLVQDTPNTVYRCSEFFKWECAKYEKVFYVLGNHEHYHGRFDKTHNELRALMPANVTVLEDQVEEYRGVMFMGSTLWTDLNKNDNLTAFHLKQCMNDYKVIQNHYVTRDVYHKLTPEHTAGVHRKTRQYFELMLKEHRNKPFVVITHHAPTYESISEKYKYDYLMNGGYASDLSDLILDNENIKFWVHGHIHDAVDYVVGSTRVLSNPRGYSGHEDLGKFNPAFTFEV
jgi:Icc-related predicted phosphoesterase